MLYLSPPPIPDPHPPTPNLLDLQNEVGTKDYFELRTFYEIMLQNVPEISGPCFLVGPKKAR